MPEIVGNVPLVHRSPSDAEVERLRLLLSTYQDGTGQLPNGENATLPGWRDFERVTAITFSGRAVESKAIFDVLLPDPDDVTLFYGVSCKMRGELDTMLRKGRATLELSNALKEFWASLSDQGITQQDYRDAPATVGQALTNVVHGWHAAACEDPKQRIDLAQSCHLALMWSPKRGRYQLFQFPLRLPDPAVLTWSCPASKRGSPAQRIVGKLGEETVLEWYGESGGQLKYYPRREEALWESPEFPLEPLPAEVERGITAKARTFFPELWDGVAR